MCYGGPSVSVSVKWGHGDPRGSKEPRVIDVLETMETLEKSHRDEGFSLLEGGGINSSSGVFSSNAHRVGREQEELEAQENCAMGGHGGNVVG